MVARDSDDPLIVTLTGDVRERILAAAQRHRRAAGDIVLEACERMLTALETRQLDDQYERGYRQVPEDTTDTAAILPHLPVPDEDWA